MPGSCALAVVMAGLAGGRAGAQTWVGASGDHVSWNQAANWSPAVLPAGGATTAIVINTNQAGAMNQNLANPFVLNSLSLGTGTSAVALSGNALSFSGVNASCSLRDGTNINAPVILTANTTFSGGTSTAPSGFNIGGGTSGAGKVILTGVMNLLSPASHTGGTHVQGGRLRVGMANVLPDTGQLRLTADPPFGGGTLYCSYNDTVGSLLVDSGSLTVDAGRTVTVSGATELQSGLISAFLGGRIVMNGAFSKTTTASAYLSNASLNGGGQVTSGSLTLSDSCFGSLTNLANVLVSMTGTNVFNVDMNNQGGLTYSLTVQDGFTANSATGTVNLLAGAILNGNVNNDGVIHAMAGTAEDGQVHTEVRQINGKVFGSGLLVVDSPLELWAPNFYTGGSLCTNTTVRGTTDAIQGNWALTGATIRFDQQTDGQMAGALSGTGTVIIRPSTGAGPGGQVALSGSSAAYTGTVNADGGNLALGSDTTAGTGGAITAGLTLPSRLSAVNGPRTMANPLVFGGAQLELAGEKELTFTDAAAKYLGTGRLLHTGTSRTTIGGVFTGGSFSDITVQSGTLVLGAAQANGFRTDGTVTVLSGAVLEMTSTTFAKLGATSLVGGTLRAVNGLVLPAGQALAGSGTIEGRIALDAGSVVAATAALQMGDGTSFAGFFSNGELQIRNATVTLADRNQAVLGSLTTLGGGGTNPMATPTLIAPNGLYVDFGRALYGGGVVNSTNALAQAIIINGSAAGASSLAPLVLNGYVKGAGTFTDVTFGGTFSPGLSPAIVPVENSTLGAGSRLVMEIGGRTPGAEHDQVAISGALALNGTLSVVLLNGFIPAAGDVFHLFDGVTTGAFSAMTLPALPAGLYWHTARLASTGDLAVGVTPEIYSAYAAAYGLGTPPSGDEDADGLTNLVEYALGLDPRHASASQPQLLRSGVGDAFSFLLPAPSPTDLELEIQSSTDLLAWPVLATRSAAGAWTGDLTPSRSPALAGWEMIQILRPDDASPRRYYRLNARTVPVVP